MMAEEECIFFHGSKSLQRMIGVEENRKSFHIHTYIKKREKENEVDEAS